MRRGPKGRPEALDADRTACHARRRIDVTNDLELDTDGARIAQVLSNLLANAAKYTEPGDDVWLEARAEENAQPR